MGAVADGNARLHVLLASLEQEVGSELFVLVAEHICLQHHLAIESELFELRPSARGGGNR